MLEREVVGRGLLRSDGDRSLCRLVADEGGANRYPSRLHCREGIMARAIRQGMQRGPDDEHLRVGQRGTAPIPNAPFDSARI
jgi:hypothetical protein